MKRLFTVAMYWKLIKALAGFHLGGRNILLTFVSGLYHVHKAQLIYKQNSYFILLFVTCTCVLVLF